MLKQQNIAETLRYRTDAAPWAEVRALRAYVCKLCMSSHVLSTLPLAGSPAMHQQKRAAGRLTIRRLCFLPNAIQ